MDNKDAAYFVDFILKSTCQYPNGFSSKIEWPVSRRKAILVHLNGKYPTDLENVISFNDLLIIYLQFNEEESIRDLSSEAWNILKDRNRKSKDHINEIQMGKLKGLLGISN